MGIGTFQSQYGNITYINDVSNANMTTGLTVNQGGADDEILALKSSDIVHGLTGQAETDTYFAIRKNSPAIGGANLRAVSEDAALATTMSLSTHGGTAGTTKTTAAGSLFEIHVLEHNGSNSNADITANGNVFGIRAQVSGSLVARFVVDEDGDIFVVTAVDVTGSGNAVAATAFDGEDDALLVRAFETARDGEGLIKTEFDKYVRYNEDDLVRFGILGAPIEEGGMWNLTQHTRLLNGAVWQLYTRLLESEAKMKALEAENGQANQIG